MRRAARTLVNEKVLAGLGRGLGSTGRLHPEGVELAFTNVERFVGLTQTIGCARLDILATAAVRDAEDGAAFVSALERRLGISVRVLSGEQEGTLSAMGVVADIAGANGIVGDLGGGSVELVPVQDASAGGAVTLPLGPLRLADVAEDEKRVRDTIDRQLATVSWLSSSPRDSFYAVGGAWRALARIHMEQVGYPLHIIQQYTLPRAEAAAFLDLVARQSRKSLEKITTVSRKRLEVVPLAARILARLIRRIEPRQVVFSAAGLREGHIYSLLDAAERQADPLIAACQETAQRDPRFGPDKGELFAWCAPLFPRETPERQRLRRAATLLGDVAWHEHPDYRAEQALRHALFMPVFGIGHAERAFVAAALQGRYGGAGSAEQTPALRLLDEDGLTAARTCGLALRLGYTLSGGVPGMLSGAALSLDDGAVVLSLGGQAVALYGESVQRRLDALARVMGRRGEVRRA
jgi:exopolyphosphatase/guanosine-5'-triphosphate,3'-diphosphate pyrophosphatase